MGVDTAIGVEGLLVERGGRAVLHEVAADVIAVVAFTLASLSLGALTLQRRTP